MAFRAMRTLGFCCRLVKGIEIAQQSLLGKGRGGEKILLLVPGGNARLKAGALGVSGLDNIREWLAKGGTYLGFCGGAGLALMQKNMADGLGLCPWTRSNYRERLYHLVSGHVRAEIDDGSRIVMPVWWPGRFAPGKDDNVHVIARYISPGDDLWLADFPLAHIPDRVAKYWNKTLGISPDSVLQPGQPLVVQGKYGKGQYILSYAHLETPESMEANRWLADLIGKYWGISRYTFHIDSWMTEYDSGLSAYPDKSQPGETDFSKTMKMAHAKASDLMRLGCNLHIFFKRQPWLWGWQSGIPGMSCNNIVAALSALNQMSLSAEPCVWRQTRERFKTLFTKFIREAEAYFWTCKLDRALDALGDTLVVSGQGDWEKRVFGHPMLGGGIAMELVELLDEYIYQLQDNIFKPWAPRP